MSVLESDAAHHMRDLVERTERGWPIGNRETGIVAGDQGSGNDQHKRGGGGKYSEAVQPAIVRCWNGLQTRLPWFCREQRSG